MAYETDPTVTQVEVTVTTDPSGGVVIVCNPNPVHISVKNSLLAFNLRTPGWHFNGTGAVVIAGKYDDFPYPSWTLNPTTAALFDVCNEPDQFDYTLTILHDTTGEEFSVDPIIDNGSET